MPLSKNLNFHPSFHHSDDTNARQREIQARAPPLLLHTTTHTRAHTYSGQVRPLPPPSPSSFLSPIPTCLISRLRRFAILSAVRRTTTTTTTTARVCVCLCVYVPPVFGSAMLSSFRMRHTLFFFPFSFFFFRSVTNNTSSSSSSSSSSSRCLFSGETMRPILVRVSLVARTASTRQTAPGGGPIGELMTSLSFFLPPLHLHLIKQKTGRDKGRHFFFFSVCLCGGGRRCCRLRERHGRHHGQEGLRSHVWRQPARHGLPDGEALHCPGKGCVMFVFSSPSDIGYKRLC